MTTGASQTVRRERTHRHLSLAVSKQRDHEGFSCARCEVGRLVATSGKGLRRFLSVSCLLTWKVVGRLLSSQVSDYLFELHRVQVGLSQIELQPDGLVLDLPQGFLALPHDDMFRFVGAYRSAFGE